MFRGGGEGFELGGGEALVAAGAGVLGVAVGVECVSGIEVGDWVCC